MSYTSAVTHCRTPRAMLDEFYAERRPSVTALIPSYQEEPGVILMTLLSTALQEYPDLRVVLRGVGAGAGRVERRLVIGVPARA